MLRRHELRFGDLLEIDLGCNIPARSKTAMSSDADFSAECGEACRADILREICL